MNHEMMIYQARQDFIDMHKGLLEGNYVSLEKYDQLASELKKLDDLNFELMLDFVAKADGFDIKQMWQELSSYIDQVKRKGEWVQKKEDSIGWQEGKLDLLKGEG